VKSKNKNYQISINDSTCSCPDYCLNQIPCKHIFAARKFLNMPLFDSKMIHKRWLKSTLSDPLPEANFQSNLIYNFQTATNISSAIQRETNKSASYNEIFRFTQELAQTILSDTEEQARDKFEVLKMIKDI
jgi:uncharacterized Zn finger protein